MARGRLRVYLGAAPGVGKTYAMLGRGPAAARARHRRRGRLRRDPRPPADRRACCDGLEVVPAPDGDLPRRRVHRDGRRRRARPPARGRPGRRAGAHQRARARATRSAGRTSRSCSTPGIDVITTVNVQHLESLNDVVEKITGVPQRETVPDAVVRAADQIELVDMAPEALRRRMAHGNVYRAGQDRRRAVATTSASATSPRCASWPCCGWPTRSTSARRYRAAARHRRDLGGPRAGRRRAHRRARGRHAASAAPRGSRPARRAATCSPCTSRAPTGWPAPTRRTLGRQRRLVESLGGTLPPGRRRRRRRRRCSTSPGAERHPARARREPARPARAALLPGAGIGAPRSAVRRHRRPPGHPRRRCGRGRRGRALPAALAAAAPAARLRARRARPAAADGRCCGPCADLNLPSDILLFLAGVVGVALVGGLWPALVAAVGGSLLLNCFFTPPLHTLTIAERDNAARPAASSSPSRSPVSAVVDARRAAHPGGGARRRRGAQTLATLAGSVLRGERPLPGAARAAARDVRADARSRPRTRRRRRDGPARQRGRGVAVVASVGADPAGTPDAARRGAGRRRARVLACGAGRCRPRTGACWRRSPRRPRSRWTRTAGRARPPAAGRSPRPTGCARRCSPRSATTCARRWPRRRPR